MRPRFAWVWPAVLAVVLVAASAHAQTPVCPPAATVIGSATGALADVRYLADDSLDGRLAGSQGERCAGDYIAGEFSALRLRPAGESGTYFQDVPLASALNPHASGGIGRNVIAALDGADPALRDEWIVIGAHYDHLGNGERGSSLAPGVREIHNGADDNASGVSVVLSTARVLAAGAKPARSVLFIAFTGEEAGLLGSAFFVAQPTVPGRIVAMINLDMVGRLGDRPLIVSGVDTADEWRVLLEPAAAAAGVALATRGGGYGPSDHTSFYLRDAPVLHLFTNSHADYHRPSDDVDRIDFAGLEKITRMVVHLSASISTPGQAMTLRRGAGRPPVAAAQIGAGGPYLGTVPDFSPVERGVRLSGVAAGSPADVAGLRAGDVIVGLGSLEVADLQGLTDALRAHKPGQSVAVRIIREGQARTLQVTIGARPGR